MQQSIDFTVHENSLHAYINDVLPRLSERQKEVLNALRYLGQATCSEVAVLLGVPHHTISGRTCELKKKGIIISDGNKIINNRPHELLKIA